MHIDLLGGNRYTRGLNSVLVYHNANDLPLGYHGGTSRMLATTTKKEKKSDTRITASILKQETNT